jgi:hypothetical protein
LYKAKLIQNIRSEDSDQAVSVEKNIELPFVPVPEISIGLVPTSQFASDEYQIERVMYLTEKDLFLVQLEDSQVFDEDFWDRSRAASIKAGAWNPVPW